MKKFMIMMLILGAAAVAAEASVTIDATVATIYADNGSTALSADSLVAWIVDVDGDGFGDMSTLTGEGFTVDDDDLLLGIGTSGVGEGYIWNVFEWANVTSPNVEGDAVGMLWFDTAYSAGATGAGEGVNYGFFDTGKTVPSDGTGGEVFYWDTLSLNANYTTSAVPEPATIGLLLAGGAAALARRKRRA